MSDNEKDFNTQVDIKVKKELEKQAFDKKLDSIIKSAEIYPDVIKSLSGLRKSVEALNKSIIEIEDKQIEHVRTVEKNTSETQNIFEKVREVLDEIKILEDKLINRNNSNSMIEIIIKKFDEQNKKMTDKNNSDSIVSMLNKSGRLQAWITWGLITVVTILGVIDKLFIGA